jgi:phosphosulfolactate phosphohydrolase-like enzyme
MQSAEIAKIEMPEATLSLRAGQQQLIGDADPASLPDELCKISRSLDRTKIKEALKTGQTIPGFELSNSPPSLTIRIK